MTALEKLLLLVILAQAGLMIVMAYRESSGRRSGRKGRF